MENVTNPQGKAGGSADRLPAEERRQALLDIAFDQLRRDGASQVTMGSVAAQAEVTRTLVYKHFSNRDHLLLDLYRREATKLDTAIRRMVAAAPDGFESKLRVFVRAAIDAIDTHGPIFIPLRGFASNETIRTEQRRWDRSTVAYFGRLAAAEYGVPRAKAEAAVSILLSGIEALLSQAGRRPPDRRRNHEALYVDLVIGALEAIGDPRRVKGADVTSSTDAGRATEG